MIFHPNHELREVNHCHGTGSKGHPCPWATGKSYTVTQATDVVDVGDTVELVRTIKRTGDEVAVVRVTSGRNTGRTEKLTPAFVSPLEETPLKDSPISTDNAPNSYDRKTRRLQGQVLRRRRV